MSAANRGLIPPSQRLFLSGWKASMVCRAQHLFDFLPDSRGSREKNGVFTAGHLDQRPLWSGQSLTNYLHDFRSPLFRDAKSIVCTRKHDAKRVKNSSGRSWESDLKSRMHFFKGLGPCPGLVRGQNAGAFQHPAQLLCHDAIMTNCVQPVPIGRVGAQGHFEQFFRLMSWSLHFLMALSERQSSCTANPCGPRN